MIVRAILFPLLLVLVDASQSSARLLGLANKWDIIGPEFDHDDGKQFSMDFTIQDQFPANNIEYTLYDGDQCAVGSNILPKDNKYISSSMDVVESTTGGNNNEHAIVSFEVQAGAVSDSTMYKVVDENHAELVLCVRFGLWTGPPSDVDSEEVNFRETIFRLRATLLNGSFQIDGLETDL